LLTLGGTFSTGFAIRELSISDFFSGGCREGSMMIAKLTDRLLRPAVKFWRDKAWALKRVGINRLRSSLNGTAAILGPRPHAPRQRGEVLDLTATEI